MDVLMINGSPSKQGNTSIALTILSNELKQAGLATEILHIGGEKIQGCLGCMKCMETKNNQCVIADDPVNASVEKLAAAQGIVVASPVYFSGMHGTLKAYLDRVFSIFWNKNDGALRFKVGGAIAIARRAGAIETTTQIRRYFEHSGMLLPHASYWNTLYGLLPGEIQKDQEGQGLLKELGKNMAWLIKAVERAKLSSPLPKYETRQYTNLN